MYSKIDCPHILHKLTQQNSRSTNYFNIIYKK